MSAPLKAKLLRFLAAPKPPGKMRAYIELTSKSGGVRVLRGLILPLAILADSAKTLRLSGDYSSDLEGSPAK
jgi:hypothetical protein